MISRRLRRTLGASFAVLFVGLFISAGGQNGEESRSAEPEHGRFTGKLLPVFYASDVLESVTFYRAAGFEFHHFYDYSAGERVEKWTGPEPPIWAEMAAGSQTFALHRIGKGKSLVVGGMRHYFLLEDVEAHYRRVKTNGLDAGELIDQPWMMMFSVTDPDGHEIYFGTEK
ncbi:MAG: VOC family protein [Planctomycetota bacterium]|jgi:hypothetical protein